MTRRSWIRLTRLGLIGLSPSARWRVLRKYLRESENQGSCGAPAPAVLHPGAEMPAVASHAEPLLRPERLVPQSLPGAGGQWNPGAELPAESRSGMRDSDRWSGRLRG